MSRVRRLIQIALLPIAALAFLLAGILFFRSPFPRDPGKADPVHTQRVEGNRWVVARPEKDAYLNDLARVTKQIMLKPVRTQENGPVTHLSISKLAESSPMYAAGFRIDDLILQVNGTPIGTMGRAVNLVHEIKACNRLTVQVQRGDQIIDYQFDFE